MPLTPLPMVFQVRRTNSNSARRSQGSWLAAAMGGNVIAHELQVEAVTLAPALYSAPGTAPGSPGSPSTPSAPSMPTDPVSGSRSPYTPRLSTSSSSVFSPTATINPSVTHFNELAFSRAAPQSPGSPAPSSERR